MTETPDIQQIADMLRQQVDEKEFIDVGLDFDADSPISKTAFRMALSLLEDEGYQIHFMRMHHMDTVNNTATFKVLVGPGVTHKDTFINRGNIRLAELPQ